MAINSYIHVTPAGAGAKTGASWAAAMGEAELETFLEGTVVAGDVIFLMEGTYTLDSTIDSSARDGTATAPIVIIGVKDTTTNEGSSIAYSDWAILATDRPLIDITTWQFTVGDYYVMKNLSFQGSSTSVVNTGTKSSFFNCKFNNNNATATTRVSLTVTDYCNLIFCEVTSENARGITTGSYLRAMFCYFHDMTNTAGGRGITFGGGAAEVVAFCIFANLKQAAIEIAGSNGCTFINNTFYNNAIDFNGTNGYGNVFINNLHEATDTGAYIYTTQTDYNFFWKNHGNDTRCTDMWNGVDTTTVFQDYAVSTGDPLFTSSSAFSLTTGSPNLNNGASIALGV